jgi:hypothetical protein
LVGKQRGEKSAAEGCRVLRVLASVKAAFKHEQVGDREEDLCIAAIYLLFKLLVFFGGAFDQLAEADQLISVLLRYDVSFAKAPIALESSNGLH